MMSMAVNKFKFILPSIKKMIGILIYFLIVGWIDNAHFDKTHFYLYNRGEIKFSCNIYHQIYPENQSIFLTKAEFIQPFFKSAKLYVYYVLTILMSMFKSFSKINSPRTCLKATTSIPAHEHV